MEQKNERFEPIPLIKTNVIRRKGYFKCEITEASCQKRSGKDVLRVGFRVIRGKYKGFNLSTFIYYDSFKSKLRLTHLCNAAGIIESLKSPEQLVGKKVKLRVVPKRSSYLGTNLIEYRITRFHPIEIEILF